MADRSSDPEPGEEMAERLPAGPVTSWVLVDGDRRALTGVLLASVFLALAAVGLAWPRSVRAVLGSGDPVGTLFQAMVTAIITGVTLVVSINQLVLSQELGAAGDQRDRMAGALSFRSEAAGHIDEPVSPADPASFLRALLSTVRERAERLERGTAATAGDDAQREVASFASAVASEAERARERLDGAEFGTFEVMGAALDFEYSAAIYGAKRLREADAVSFSAEGRRAMSELLDALELYGTAREHFKTLYFQWELIDLSRVILAAAVPALVTAVAMVLFFDPAGVPGSTLGTENVLWVVTAATLVSVSPFLVFIAYILRIVTVAKRTLAIGPFLLRETEDGVLLVGQVDGDAADSHVGEGADGQVVDGERGDRRG
jgi:hypothetical protein